MPRLTVQNGACVVTVKVTPRASKSELLGAEAEWYRVRLQAPPVDGKANEALIKFFSEHLNIPKRAITILAGETGRLKRIRIEAPESAIRAALDAPVS